MHADHFLDLMPFACALSYAPRQLPVPVASWPGTDHPARPRLFVPPGASELLRAVAAAGGQPELIDTAFELERVRHRRDGRGRPPALRAFSRSRTTSRRNAIAITSTEGGGRFVFGADHGPTDALREFAAGADLLMLEASLPFPMPDDPSRGHLTAAEAGEHAAGCGAARLVLTHITDELDHERRSPTRARGYDGPIEIAADGRRLHRLTPVRRATERGSLSRWPGSAICSPTSSACAGRWTSCSAMCSAASG